MGLEYLNEQKARAKRDPQPVIRPPGDNLRAASRLEAEKFWRNLEAKGEKRRVYEEGMRAVIESCASRIDPQTNEGLFSVFTGKDEPADNEYMKGKVAAMRMLAYEMGYEITGLKPNHKSGTAAGKIKKIIG